MIAHTVSEMRSATLAYYPLKGDANDYTSNGRNGTITGEVSFVPGVYGPAAHFQSGASVQLPVNQFDRYANHYVLAAWVNLMHCSPVPGETSSCGVIAGRLSVSYETGKLLLFFYFDSPISADNHLIVLESQNPLPTETWTSVLVMYDQDTRQLRFFINGILDSTVSLHREVAPADRPHLPVAFAIGSSGSSELNTFNGSVSDVIIIGSLLDTCCINGLGGAMSSTRVRASGNRVVPIIAYFAVPVFLAVAANILALVNLITDDSTAPLSTQMLTPQQVADKIREIVGSPAKPGHRATREKVGIFPFQRVHVDVGGLGPYVHRGGRIPSGFIGALNMNDVTVNADSIPPNQPVPNLILVASWRTNPMYPLGDGFADYVTMQSAPLWSNYVSEVARIIRPGGMLGLWIDRDTFGAQINELAAYFKCTPLPCTAANRNLDMDEFRGAGLFPKLLLVNNRTV